MKKTVSNLACMWNEDTRNTPQDYLLFSTVNLSNYITVSSWEKKITVTKETIFVAKVFGCQNPLIIELVYSYQRIFLTLKSGFWSGVNNEYQDFRFMITGCRTKFPHCDPTIRVAEIRYMMRFSIWYRLYNYFTSSFFIILINLICLLKLEKVNMLLVPPEYVWLTSSTHKCNRQKSLCQTHLTGTSFVFLQITILFF